jgi:hypothetical protein
VSVVVEGVAAMQKKCMPVSVSDILCLLTIFGLSVCFAEHLFADHVFADPFFADGLCLCEPTIEHLYRRTPLLIAISFRA